ncbi:MAG: hypothetical protein ACOZCO_08540 [Bacteroidota bacterium]
MKALKLFIWLLPVCFLMTACPVGIDYPADEEGKNAIDKKLIGTWKCSKPDHEIVKMKIEAKDKNTYTINILEKGGMYSVASDKWTAWITTIDKYRIIYAKPEGENQYYHYCYEVEKSTLRTWDISLLAGGVDAVTSTQSLREEIKASSEKEEFLSSETVYEKE